MVTMDSLELRNIADVAQMIVYLGGAILAGIIIITKLPDGLMTVREYAGSTDKFNIFNFGFHLSFREFIREPYTFFTALIAGSVFSLASHGTDQLIVQRVLTCKDVKASQKAMSWSGIAVFLQFLLFLVLGVLLYSYYGGVSYGELGLARADGIFPKFIVEEMPTGISGLIVAALFAAAMSTLSSSLSSLSSAATLDIYIPLTGKGKSEKELLKTSRKITLLWGVVLIAASSSFIGLKEGTVVELALGIASYTYGGLLGVFLLGLFSKKATQKDAIYGFVVALIVMTVFIQTIQIAWPLYTIVGSGAAVITGILSEQIFRRRRLN